MLTMASRSGWVAGTHSTSSATSWIVVLPSVATAMTRAPRERTSWRLDIVTWGLVASVTTAITVVPGCTRAMAPCLSSPAG